MPLPSVSLNQGQSVTVTISPEDANGNPASIFGAPTWAIAPPGTASEISLNVNGGGMGAVITAETPGTYQIDVSFTPTQGANPITSSFDVIVAEDPATQLIFSFGTPS
jgi:hypothetical protein